MTGKLLVILLVLAALFAGGGLYYLQVYHFYEEVVADGQKDVRLTSLSSDAAEPILYQDFRAIDANSSPIRYRACFTTQMSQALLSETYVPYERAVPLQAPGWFDCFDAEAVGAALEDGSALAFMGQAHIQYGIDRVVAIDADGRGFVWHQINRCGKVVFDGLPAPDDCPEPPEGY